MYFIRVSKTQTRACLTQRRVLHAHFGPNIFDLYCILTFLVNRGLLAARRRRSCGNRMVLRDDNSDDRYHWECPVNQSRKRALIRAGSFFEDSKIPLSHWLYIIFLWSIDESNKKVLLLTGFLLCTVITALQRLVRDTSGP